MTRCEVMAERLKEGIEALEANDNALEAFRFANHAMARQRVRSIYALGRRRGEKVTLAELDVVKNRSWRPFQLAFILLSIPALANPKHRDRTEPLEAFADLLWFPTGGGKTEAYLGVAAFTMAIRRLQGNLGGYDAGRGLAVIMRYTLRLLTIQQFQRATTLLCAMEMLREESAQSLEKWGKSPFTLGLWVGNKVTPGNTEQSHKVIEAVRDGQRTFGATPAQLTFCPWCGSSILEGRDIIVDRDEGRKPGVHRVPEAEHAALPEQHVVGKAGDDRDTDLREHRHRQAAGEHQRGDDHQRSERAPDDESTDVQPARTGSG